MYCPHGHLDAPSHRYTDKDTQTQIHLCEDDVMMIMVMVTCIVVGPHYEQSKYDDGGRNEDNGNHDDDGDHE